MANSRYEGMLFFSFVILIVPVLCQIPPGPPQINAPVFILENTQVTLSCSSAGGDPSPSVMWYEGDTLIDDTFATSGGVTTNEFSFVAEAKHHLIVYECRIDNNVLQNPLAATWFFQVYAEPDLPTITGPTTLIADTPTQWNCRSEGGYPKVSMQMRYGNTDFTSNQITETSQFLVGQNSFTVDQIATWAPSKANNGIDICCQVDHPQTRPNNPQIVCLTLTVNDPLSINAPQLTYTPTIGTTFTMVCDVTGVATEVRWFKNNSPTRINIASDSRMSGGSVNTPSLTIRNAQASDSGQYVCQATDGSRTVDTNTITVSAQSLPTVTIQQPSYTTNYGNSVTLVCTVSAVPFQTKVYWRKDNTLLINSGDNGYSGSTPGNPSLTINSATTSDQGQYRCYAENPVGNGNSDVTTLTVVGGLLNVVIPQPSYSAVIGTNSVTITCTVTGTPAANSVSWTKLQGGQTTNLNIANSNGKYSGGTVNSPSLTIFNIAQSDEANYACSATNIAGTSSSQQAFLDVTGSIPVVQILQPSYTTNYGDPVTLECTVTSNPLHTIVTWQKITNGQPSTLNTGNAAVYSGATVSNPSLTILSANLADPGVYRCLATNVVGTGQSQDTTLTVSGDFLSVSIPQPSYSAVLGTNSVTITCFVSGTPSATSVTWTKTVANGVSTNVNIGNSNGKYQGGSVNNPSLTILNIVQSDEANYVCRATNLVGTSSSQTAFLDVTGELPIVNILQPSYSVQYGNSITVECTVTANPFHTTVFWQKIINGQPNNINLGNSAKYTGGTVNNPSLTIQSAVTADSGDYRCSATNAVGTGQSQDSTVTVTGGLLTVLTSQTSYSVVLGTNSIISIGCVITGTPSAFSVSWTKIHGGQSSVIDIANSNGKYQGGTVNNPTLTIFNVAQSDEANYVCSATNIVGTSFSQQAYLDVTGSIPAITVLSTTYSVVYGNAVTLGCTVTANPSHTNVYWQRVVNGQAYNINYNIAKYSGSTVGSPSLTILSTTSDDGGVYRCLASNAVGTGQSQDIRLSVDGGSLSVTVSQTSLSTNVGSNSVFIECIISGVPSATSVSWLKTTGGQTTTLNIAGNTGKYQGGSLSNPSLTILNIAQSDEGTYVCSATNIAGTSFSQQAFLDVTGSLPVVNILQSSYTAMYGNSITIECTVSANPPPTSVFWQRIINGQTNTINLSNTAKYTGGTVNNPSLTIQNALMSDSGDYRCLAANAVGTGQSQDITFTVTGGLLNVVIPQPSYSAIIGTNSVTIGCVITGTPSAFSVSWTKIQEGRSSIVEIANSNGKYQGGSVNDPSLTIRNVVQSDESNYVCSATNIAGTSSSQQAFLDVTGSLPVVTILSPSYSVVYGNPVTLGCTVNANPLHTTVFWQRIINGQAVNINFNTGKYSGSSVNTPSLTISSTTSDDIGDYRCLATNAVGTGQSQDTTLTVDGGLLSVTIPQPSYSAILGSNSVFIECIISGIPSATSVTWTKNTGGQTTTLNIVGSNGKYQGGSVSNPSLTILNIAQSDEANYVCSATNIAGTASSQQAFLDVTGSIPVVTILSPTYSVIYGNPVTLGCTVNANPLHTTVFWQRITNGQAVNINFNTGKYSGSSVNTPSLTISSTTSDDIGDYRCLATNVVGTGQSQDTTLTVDGGLLSVTIPQPSYSAILGSNSVFIECIISGIPSATSVTWTKNTGGQTTTLNIVGSNGKYQGGSVSNPSLTILNIVQSDEANYVCSATNIAGTASSQQAFLDVTGSLPVVTILQPTYSTLYGNDVTLECTVQANPLHTVVFWQRIINGQAFSISLSNSGKYTGSTVNNPSLTIRSTTKDDPGVYRCSATNAVGTGQSQDTTLVVTGDLLDVRILQDTYSALLGSNSVTIECTVNGIPSATSVSWRKSQGGQSTNLNIAGSNGKYQGGSVSNPSLTILNIAQSDEANYVCSASNIVGTANSQTAFLDVTGNPPTVTILQPSYSVLYGNTITIECTVTANPAHTTVFWQKIVNGQPNAVSASDSTRYTGGTVNTPSLTIQGAVTSDSGIYRCSATNAVGTGQSQDSTLTVTGEIPAVVLSKSNDTVIYGDPVIIECKIVYQVPEVSVVYWEITRNAVTKQLNTDSSNGKYNGSTVLDPSLAIYNAVFEDEGRYQCFAENIIGTGSSSEFTLKVMGGVLNVDIPQSSYQVDYSNIVTLECIVTGTPTATEVYWKRTTNSVTTDIDMTDDKYSGSTVNSPSLTIRNAVLDDEGTYKCFAVNIVGTGESNPTDLDVIGNPPIARIGSSNYNALVGNTITIDCTVTANPVVQNVYWERDINGVVTTIGTSTNPSKYGGSTTVNPSLTIFNVDFSDEGNYKCFATNIVGTGNSNQGFLDISGQPPTVVITLPNYQTDFGSTVTLGCTVTANPIHTDVYWKKIVNGVTTDIGVANSGGKYSGSTVNSPSLVINNANLDDRASYVCYAENSIGTGQSTTTVLNILGEIPTVVVPQPQYNVDYGNDVTLTCTVTANPIHTNVYWQRIRNGVTNTINVASSNNKYTGSTVSNPSLTIKNVVLSDEATFICFATNGVGTGQSSQTFVDINGALPSVAVLSNSYSVVATGTITLQCVVTANPLHTVVQWQKVVNGQITDVVLGNRLSGSTVNSPSLTISQADFGDEGNYICTATNAVGTGTSQQTFLDVTGTPPTAIISQSQYQGSYGQSVTLVCTVTANPAATRVYWRRLQNGQMNDISVNNNKYTGSTVGTPSITVSGLDLTDEGFYQCYAENSVGTGSSQQTFLDVLGNIPTVKVLSNSYNVIVGNTITLGCQVDATPQETVVFWRRVINGQLTNIDLGTNNNNKYSGSSVPTPSLTISNAQNSDEGNYVCYATNLAGTGQSSQTFLDVVGSPPVVSIAQSSYSVNIGNPITLSCTVSATPPEFSVYWTRSINNQQAEVISTSNSAKYSGSTVSSPSLVVLNTVLGDIGVYRCFAENVVGVGQSNTTTLTVVGTPPIVTIEQSTYTVNYGNTATLTCTVTSTPLHTVVYWRKVTGGQQVALDLTSSKYSGSTVSTPSLTISNTDLNDETFYVCYATNAIGTGQSSQTYLDVLGSQPVVRVLSNSYSVLTGQTATLECTITATPAATSVQWYKVVGGQQQAISSSQGKYNTPTVFSPNLVISNSQSSDEGYYVCSATNPVATASSSQTFLDVTGNAPTVTVSLPNYNTKEGTTVTLACTVISSPSATRVFWTRVNTNGQSSQIDMNNQKYGGSSVSNPSLVIFNPTLDDEGNYVCYAENVIGQGQSQQTYLDVTGAIPTVTIQQSLYSVDIAQRVTLECTVVASPLHTVVYWQKVINGVATTITSNQNKYSGSTVSVPSLTISNVDFNDEAYYICFATNEVGTGQSAQTYLDIIGSRPIVNIGSSSYSVNYANSISLVCTVTANPLHTTVSWTKIQNGVSTNIVVSNTGKYSGATVSQPSLTINNAGNTDEAFYVCSATNSVGTGQSSQTYLDVVGELPLVQILSNYYSVEIGKAATVECQVQANPSHNSVQWRRVMNGVTSDLDISNSNKYFGGSVNTPSLTIQNTADSDEGYYICTATNAVGTGISSQSYVDVTGSILSVTVPQPSYSVNYGQNVQLVCTVSGNPAATSVYWEKLVNGVKTTITSSTNPSKYSGASLTTPSLTVLNANADDQAVYTCIAENAIGKGQSQQTQLQIIGSVPSVTVGQGYSVNLGSSITLKCTVFATPSATVVEWNKFDANGVANKINILSQTSKYSGGSVNTPSLTIQNAEDSDEAYYTCRATNAAGTGVSTQTYLDVLGSIPIVTIPQPQYSVTVGNTITMQCSIAANPAHNQVMWKKIVNGSPVDVSLGGRYNGATVATPSLTINNAESGDKGYYVCYASNSVGQGQSAQTYLNVVGSVPVVTVLSTSYSINIANSVTLQCTVSASPAATTVQWQRIVNNNAVNIDMSNSRYSGSTISSPSLVISNAAGTDEGFYVCMASNIVGTGQSQQTFVDVVGSIAQVTVPVPSYTVNRGASITLECSYTANPEATSVTWERIVGGQATDISPLNNNKYGGSTTQSPSLIINDAKESDEGSYICKVTNSIGTGISSATSLDVVGNIPLVTASPLAYSVNVGGTRTLQCRVTADPLHTSVTWKKIVGGTTTNINVGNSGGKYEGSSVSSPPLVINNAAFSDQGTYVCFATNSVGTGQSTQVVVAVAGSPPIVTLSQDTFSANFGETITLGCIISADPVETSVYWQKISAGSGAVTIDMSNVKYSGSTVSQPSLSINDVGSGDIAEYVCFAANSVGTGQSSRGSLTVAGSTPLVRISQTTYPVNIGKTITIDCTVTANPAHTTVYWTRQIGSNQPVTLSTTGAQSTKYGGSSVVSPSLTVYNVEESDQGSYVCHATNIVGTGHSSQAFLDVVGNVPVVTATTVQSTRVGSSITVQCSVIANPAAIDITWAKYINNQPTPIDILNNNRLTGGTVAVPSLTINPVEQDDEGNYVCQARNNIGTGSSNQVFVDVTGDPPTLIVINPTKITIEEGQTITATCTAQGSPEPTYTWYKAGSNVEIATGGVYEVINAPKSALGTYTCKASNNYGSTEATVIVDVQYKPEVTISKTTASFDGVGQQSINIPCSYISNPAATSVFWTKFTPVPGSTGTTNGNTEIIIIDGSKYGGGNLNSPSLTIYNLDRSDMGSYRCSASNIIGQGDSNYITLGVDTNAAPSFIRITPSQIVIEEGNSYTLTCEADGDPAPLYEWYYKDIKIHEGNVLIISNAVYNLNDGLHTCKASNKVGSRQVTVDVDVKYPPISAVSQSSFNPALGNAVTLRCDTLANPSSTAWTWKYNGFDIDFTGKTYLVDMDSTSDAGRYTCIAYNEVGQSSEIEFTVGLGEGPTPTPRIVETVVSAGLTGGEIAAICLAALFAILLMVIIIVCCIVQGCCRAKRRPEKERYIERVITREAEMPTAVVREPSVVSVREVTPRISYVDDSYRYMTTSSRPYYLPIVEATYDDEENRRLKKKKKKSKRYHEELARDDGIYLEERVVGSVRGSRKGDEVITGPEMYFEAE